MPAAGPAERRVLTIPNVFTAVRLACIPVFLALLLQPHRRDWFPAAVLLAALGATDWLDGFLARRLGQVSALGKVLDPTADRLLIVTAGVGTAVLGAVPPVVAVITLTREVVVGAGFVAVAFAGGVRMDVRMIGKAGTFGLMCALPLYLAGHSAVGWHAAADVAAWVFAVPALALAWTSVLVYAPLAWHSLREAQPS